MPSKNNIPAFKILIDSRETKPWTFQGIKPNPPAIKVIGLRTGDYSVEGLSDLVTVERKEVGDLFSSVGKNRDRFERELIRMAEFDYACIIIEAEIKQWFINPPSHSKMSPKSVLRSLFAFSQRYGVHVWCGWDRESSEKFCYIILKRYYNDYIARKGGKLK